MRVGRASQEWIPGSRVVSYLLEVVIVFNSGNDEGSTCDENDVEKEENYRVEEGFPSLS